MGKCCILLLCHMDPFVKTTCYVHLTAFLSFFSLLLTLSDYIEVTIQATDTSVETFTQSFSKI